MNLTFTPSAWDDYTLNRLLAMDWVRNRQAGAPSKCPCDDPVVGSAARKYNW